MLKRHGAGAEACYSNHASSCLCYANWKNLPHKKKKEGEHEKSATLNMKKKNACLYTQTYHHLLLKNYKMPAILSSSKNTTPSAPSRDWTGLLALALLMPCFLYSLKNKEMWLLSLYLGNKNSSGMTSMPTKNGKTSIKTFMLSEKLFGNSVSLHICKPNSYIYITYIKSHACLFSYLFLIWDTSLHCNHPIRRKASSMQKKNGMA